MNKSKIKTFAIWARQKLMDDVRGNASLIGITEAQIDDPLSQSTSEIQYFDIGTNEPYIRKYRRIASLFQEARQPLQIFFITWAERQWGLLDYGIVSLLMRLRGSASKIKTACRS